ncbi:MAG: hypothetical protein ACE14L_08280 [Terriglobales bacterium]
MSRDIVREFIARCDEAGRGGTADPYALLDENVNVMVNGTTALSGQFPNLECVRSILVNTAKARIRSAHFSVTEFVGSGSRLAALLMITAQTVDGRTYNQEQKPCGAVFTVVDGKIRAIQLYPLTSQIETVLFHKTFVSNGAVTRKE